MDEEQHTRASIKRKRPQKILDKKASYGPPDKSEHFLGRRFRWFAQTKERKVDQQSTNKSSAKKEVEVLYSDGVWYRGWLGDYNIETGKWVVHFYEDNETTEVNFPDDEVRVLN